MEVSWCESDRHGLTSDFPMVVHLGFGLLDVADGLHQPVTSEARGLSSEASSTAPWPGGGQLSGVELDRAKDRIRCKTAIGLQLTAWSASNFPGPIGIAGNSCINRQYVG